MTTDENQEDEEARHLPAPGLGSAPVEVVEKMRIRLFAMSLALTFAGGLALAAEPETQPQIPAGTSEPTKCYRLMAESGLEVPVGQAVELCAGTVAAVKTYACFIEAWGPSANNGLGLTLGLAVDLCRTIPREGP
jgi:hypothetical protein